MNQIQRRNDTEKERGLQVILPLDLGLRLPEDKSLSLLIEITEEMDYRELYAAYEQSFRSIITVLKRRQFWKMF